MNIKFSNDFTAIANAGDTNNVDQTAANMVCAVYTMIREMYPYADVEVVNAQQMSASCVVYGATFNGDDFVASRVLAAYVQNELFECWA